MQNDYYGYVYKITYLRNGKTYVGQHRYWDYPNIDPNYHGSCPEILNLRKQYGAAKFKEEILEWCKTQEELDRRELELTLEHNAFKDQGGYVRRAGSGHHQLRCEETKVKAHENHWNLGNNMSQEHLDKLTASHTGVQKSDETKRKISVANKGNKPWCTGKNLSKETRNKISTALQGREFTPDWCHKLSTKATERNTGRHWFTNGKEDRFVEECPEGFYRGRSQYPRMHSVSQE